MSRHEGVSCDSCLKTNFRCRRYKCLICYDYDLCANCYEEGVTSTRHLSEHPMQCILTRSDFELYYGGEVLGSDQPQSFTCPFCKKMGFSDSGLFEHVSAEHTDNGYEVVCPVCAALPGGDPNLVTDDFAGHLTIEHRTGNRDLISFLDEPSAIRHGGVRRIPHSGRPISGPRPRRTTSGLPVIYPVGRDPTAEILFQLSGGRLGAPPSAQLQQIQTQIQLERQQVTAARQQLERLPRLPTVYTSIITGNTSNASGGTTSTTSAPQQVQSGVTSNLVNGRDIVIASNSLSLASSSNGSTLLPSQSNQSQFLLNRFMAPTLVENETVQMECDRADRSQFVHNLLLSTLSDLEVTQRPTPIELEEEDVNLTAKKDGDHVSVSKTDNDDPSINVETDTKIDDIVPQQQNVQVTGSSGGGGVVGQHQQQSQQQQQQQQQQQHQQQRVVNASVKQKSPSSTTGGKGGLLLANTTSTTTNTTTASVDRRHRSVADRSQQGTNVGKGRELKSTPSTVSSANRTDNGDSR